MEKINDYLERVSATNGFTRERYIEKNLPTHHDNLLIFLFLPDDKHRFIGSTLILPRLEAADYASKYLIVVGYHGNESIYPYADEYWGLKDQSISSLIREAANGFENTSARALTIEQQLNRYFTNLTTGQVLKACYDGGLTEEFFKRYTDVTYTLPQIASPKTEFVKQLSQRSGHKVFVRPDKWCYGTDRHRETRISIPKEFWRDLLNGIVERGYCPVVHYTPECHNISAITSDKCVYCLDTTLVQLMASMRAVGCVIDVFGHNSYLAMLSRTPFVSCMDRQWYVDNKEFEIDTLCTSGVPYERIFSFPNRIENNQWGSLIDLILNRLDDFVPLLDRSNWASTTAMVVQSPYKAVQEKKKQRIGTRFFKVPKIN